VIELQHVSKDYATRHGDIRVLSDVSLRVNPGQKLGILGRNGAGKSTLVRLLGGAEQPTVGQVIRHMSVSWPLAFSAGFAGSLTGYDYLRFVCRVYNVPTEGKLKFVLDFSELGRYFYEPVQTYSAGMTARLAFAVSMAIDFDCYLIDEIVAVGDARFTERCDQELFGRRGHKAMVMVSHNAQFIQQHCDSAAVLHQGRLLHFDSVQHAYDAYHQILHSPVEQRSEA